MKKIQPGHPESMSQDIVSQNIEQLRSLFPEAWTEGKLDFDVLRQLLGDVVDDREEKFGLNWHGKRNARRLALTPSVGTLRPCPEESVDWDTTQNLMIEGDNLEVLKLLQKSYAGRVKMIYIDPPYNTGSDFVYPDDFQDSIRNYLVRTGQIVSDGRSNSSNSETSGRFHTTWLQMMYPRLKLAQTLMTHDAVIFISVDDGEIANLRLLGNEIFGEENFLGCFIWKSRQNKDNRTTTGASIDHEYVLCFGNSIRGASRDRTQYSNPDGDTRGDWTSANMVGIATSDRRPNLHYDLVDPTTNINYGCPDMGWRYEPSTMAKLIEEKRILWPTSPEGRPRRKAFLNELDSDFTGFSTIVGEGVFTRDGTADIDALFDVRIFSFPKPIKLLQSLVEQGSGDGEIVLDFFAGSGSTAHAVMSQNACDGMNRRHILVQLPEVLDTANRDQKTAADFCSKIGKPMKISELTKERLRRAGKAVQSRNPLFKGDIGFRVYRLDSSNISPWAPNGEDLHQDLIGAVEHIRSDRSTDDLLCELLLKLGLDLCVPILSRSINGLTVHSIGAGTLMVCLEGTISPNGAEPLALGIVTWHKEQNPAGDSTVVFRDSAFADDVTKTNVTLILQQHGFENVRSL